MDLLNHNKSNHLIKKREEREKKEKKERAERAERREPKLLISDFVDFLRIVANEAKEIT